MKKNYNAIPEDGQKVVCGGIHRTQENMSQKTIHSTQVISFECEFSLVSFGFNKDEKDKEWNGVFELSAELVGSRAHCHYVHSKRRDGTIDKTFDADCALLDELEKVIREEDLARFNGYSSHTSGLPDMYGANLTVYYASGEHIYTSNNQDVDLPLSALRAFKAIFEKYLPTAGQSVINPALKTLPMLDADVAEEDFDAGWVCGCGAKNPSGTTKCSSCGEQKPSGEPTYECICGLKFFGEDLPPFCPDCGDPID